MVHIDRADFHAVIRGIAHKLGRLIKPDRLAIEKCRSKCRRMVTLEPGRDVDERETLNPDPQSPEEMTPWLTALPAEEMDLTLLIRQSTIRKPKARTNTATVLNLN